MYSDDQLMKLYCSPSAFPVDGEPEPTHSFDSYYPIRMTSPGQCRACSWYLACLTVINFCENELLATKHAEVAPLGDDQVEGDAGEFQEEDGEKSADDDDDNSNEEEVDHEKASAMGPMSSYIVTQTVADPPGHNSEHVHSLMARHAIHRIMGAFVPLFYHMVHDALNLGLEHLTGLSHEWKKGFVFVTMGEKQMNACAQNWTENRQIWRVSCRLTPRAFTGVTCLLSTASWNTWECAGCKASRRSWSLFRV